MTPTPSLAEVGADLATRWQTVLAVDFDRSAAATYRANFPDVEVRCASVADELDRLLYADVICGGPPCQPFSDAGENEGESDDRDGWPDFCRAVELGRPRQFLAENVRGILKTKHRDYFLRILARLADAGYVVKWRMLDAVNFGVPQFRKRVWIWGIRRDLYAKGMRHVWPEATHQWPACEGGGLFGGLATGITVRQALGLDGELHRKRGAGMSARAGGRRDHPTTEPSPAITASFAGGGGGGLFLKSHADAPVSIDRPSPTLRSGGDEHDDCRPEIVRVTGGGSNPREPGGVRTERDITDEPSTTIAAQHTHNALPAIEYRWSDEMLTKHPPASPASPAPTVQAKYYKGGAEGLLEVNAGPPLLVRRLTPLECARLQSVPDDFAWPEGTTKTAMYRVIGNGWASEMARHMSASLAAVDPDSRTVMDLFSGGGLGAVGWHGRSWRYAAPHPGARDE